MKSHHTNETEYSLRWIISFLSLNNMMEFDIFPSLQNSGQYLIILDTVQVYHRSIFSFFLTSSFHVYSDPLFPLLLPSFPFRGWNSCIPEKSTTNVKKENMARKKTSLETFQASMSNENVMKRFKKWWNWNIWFMCEERCFRQILLHRGGKSFRFRIHA